MVKNIVFDMGKVLVNYDAMKVCEYYIENLHDRRRVCTAVFVSPEWLMLDMGLLTEEQALKQICARLPERLHKAAVWCMEHWTEYNMWTIREMEPVIRELKRKGFGIYLCSNASARLPQCYRQVLPAAECFDGILFSAQIKCMKPQREMYRYFFERFHLLPEECFFVDDLQVNIDSAKACGMDGYCFADGDTEKLKAILMTLN